MKALCYIRVTAASRDGRVSGNASFVARMPGWIHFAMPDFRRQSRMASAPGRMGQKMEESPECDM